MPRKRKFNQEKNPLQMVLYIVVVVLLIGCLAFLVYHHTAQKRAYEEAVKQAASNETEFIPESSLPESETETESAAETKAETEPETPETKETATESATEKKDITILVLNGTRKEGVAGYWQARLEEAGYTNVISASYTGAIGEETVIFSEDRDLAKQFQEQFPNGMLQSGIVEDGIEAVEGSVVPEKCDVYILVGSKDARSE